MTMPSGTDAEFREANVAVDRTRFEPDPVPAIARCDTRRQRKRAAGIALLLLAGARYFDVGIAGIVTNDSLGYLRRSEAPLAGGIVSQGYRQAAYPVFVMFSNLAADLLGWDHIFGVALLQRTILLVGIAITIWAMRWWSAPVMAVLTSSTVVIHGNLLLPEGLLIPLCVNLGGLGAAVVLRRTNTTRTARMTMAMVGVCVALAASLKLQYAVLITILAAVGWTLHRDGLVRRRFAIITLGSVLGFIVVLSLAQSFENSSELGVFEPVSERARAEWYGAWQSIFVVDPDNQLDPALASFWDDGSLYTFMHGIEATVDAYPERASLFRQRIEELFDAAGTSEHGQQLRAFIGALGMGRLDDIGGIVQQVLQSGDDPETAASFNLAYRHGGLTEIVEAYNDGHAPGAATFGPLLSATQSTLAHHRALERWLSWLSIGLMLASLFIGGRHRALSAAILVGIVAYAGALSTGYIDNARYLLGPYILCLVGGTLAAQAAVLRISQISIDKGRSRGA